MVTVPDINRNKNGMVMVTRHALHGCHMKDVQKKKR